MPHAKPLIFSKGRFLLRERLLFCLFFLGYLRIHEAKKEFHGLTQTEVAEPQQEVSQHK